MSEKPPPPLYFTCQQCSMLWFGRPPWERASKDVGDAGWRLVYYGGYRLVCGRCEKMYPPQKTVSV